MTSDGIAHVSAWLVVATYVLALISEFRRLDEKYRRLIWAAGALSLLGHTLWTMLVVHQGSFQEAFDHTSKKTEQLVGMPIGAGLYVNFAMLAIWLADAAAWCIVPNWRISRQKYLLPMHFVFGFLFLNAAIVFASTEGRILGLAALAIIVVAWLLPRRTQINASAAASER